MAREIASLYASLGADTTQLDKGLAQAKSGLLSVAETGKSSGGSLISTLGKVGLAVGGVTTAALALGAAVDTGMDLGRQGASLQYAETRFDRLSRAMGRTADVMKADLKAATKGMVSDADLVGSAGDIMALGLMKSADQVVRLTKVSGSLGMDMNQLVLTLANMTTMRFDQLGVSIDGFDARVQKLKDSGLDAASAFREAFLQQAEAQVEKVGQKSETAAAKFARLDAATKNLGDTVKLWFAPGMADAAQAMADFLTAGQRTKDSLAAQETEIRKTKKSWEEYVRENIKANEAAGNNAVYNENIEVQMGVEKALENSAAAMGILDRATYEALNGIDAWNSAAREGMAATNALAASQRAAAEAARIEGEANDAMASKYQAVIDKSRETQTEILKERDAKLELVKVAVGGQFGQEDENFADRQKKIRDQIDETKAKLKEMGAPEMMDPKDASKADELQKKMLNVNQQIVDIAKGAGVDWKKVLNAKDLDTLDLAGPVVDQIKGLRGESYSLYDQIKKLGGVPYATEEQKKQIEDLRGTLGDLETELDKTAKEHEEAMKKMAFGMIQESALSGMEGKTSEQKKNIINNLTTIAQQWGLYDQKTADVVTAINDNLGQLDTSDPSKFLGIMQGILALPSEKDFKITVSGPADFDPKKVYNNIRGGPDADLVQGLHAEKETAKSASQEIVQSVQAVGAAYKDTSGMDTHRTKMLEIQHTYTVLKPVVEKTTDAVRIFKDLWDSLESKYLTLRVINESIDPSYSPTWKGKVKQNGQASGFVDDNGATGLDLVVPAGYPNESFRVAASSGERIRIQTATERALEGNRNSGNVTNNFYISGVTDPQAVAREVSRLLGQQIRRNTFAGAGGVGG